MKKCLLIIAGLFLFNLSFGQLSGVKSIPGDYATISAAVTALNAAGVGAGGVTFNVAAGYTETLTARIDMTATGTLANPIVFQKSGSGANPKLTSYTGTALAGSATPDGIWSLTGSDYVTIDGIDLQDAAGNTTATTTMEYGYGLFKASGTDGANNNTIKNCTITLNRVNFTTAAGPYFQGSCGIVVMACAPTTGTAVTAVTAVSGASSNNKFYTNTIQNCNCCIAMTGFASAAPYTFSDYNNDIGGSSLLTGNNLINFGGGASASNAAAGVFIKDQWSFNVSYNTINNNNGSGVNHPNVNRGIWANSSSLGASATFNNNTITMKGGGNYQVSCIETSAGASGAGNTITINNNTITNCTNVGATSQAWYGIYNNGASAANLNIQYNTFSGNTNNATSGSTYLIYNSGAVPGTINMTNNNLSQSFPFGTANTGTLYCVYNGSGTLATTLNINNNNFSAISYTTTGSGSIYFIYNTNSCAFCNINTNTWTNLSLLFSGSLYFMYNSTSTQAALNVNNNSIVTGFTRTAASGALYIYYSAASSLGTSTQTFSGNNFSNITSTTSGSGAFYGIYCNDGSASPYPRKYFFNNTFSNINIATSGTWYTMYLNYLGDGTSSTGSMVYSNTISNITSAGSPYGLYISTTASPTVAANCYGNNINNITTTLAAGTVYGAYLGAAAGGLNFYNNNIYKISANGATGTAYGIYTTTAIVLNIYNNFVSEIYASASTHTSPAPATTGIYISGGTLVNVYNNSIYISGTSSSTNFGSACIYANSSPTVNLINNVMVNNITPKGTGKAIAYQRSSTTLTTYGAGSNNNCMYAGTPGAANVIFYDGTNSDQTFAAYLSRVTPRDYYSFSENAPFLNTAATPFNLHMNTATATQCEKGGQVITTPVNLNTDYDGDARLLPPDVGADEFAGTAAASDLTPPVIYFTALTNTALTTARTLTATITDATGVPVSGSGLPVLYWKINAGSYTPATGVSIGGSLYTFTFGTGVNPADVVSYYIVAQDMAGAPNVISNPIAGASGFTTGPPACSTPPTTPFTYTISAAFAGGDYYIGTSAHVPAQSYATLTAAVADLNAKTITGPINLILTDATYPLETFPINLNPNAGSSATNTVTIKPETGKTSIITGSASGSTIFLITGFDYLIIDGSNSGGTDKSLTWENTSTTTNSVAIGLTRSSTDPATNNTIKNCIIRCANTPITTQTYGINFVGSQGGEDNTVINNNTIYSCWYGIYCSGQASQMTNNVQITNNIIGSSSDATGITSRGIYVTSANNTLISGNEIMGQPSGNSNTQMAGIYVAGGSVNTKIRNNKIHDFYYNSTSGNTAYGIYYGSDASTITEISNNVIYNIKGDGGTSVSTTPAGIYINSGGNFHIYFNSIYMTGSVLSGTNASWSSCLAMSTGVTLLDLRDNVFKNSMQPVSGSGNKTYAIYSSSPGSAFSTINYNDYYVDGINANLGFLVYILPTFANWQFATVQDLNSLNTDPQFSATNDLHPTSAGINNAGITISGITTDLDGVTRSVTPDMGAYEFNVFDQTSKAEAPVTQVPAAAVPSIAVNTGTAVNVLAFKIHDFGSGDGLPTKVTNIRIKNANPANGATWSANIAGVTLNNGAPVVIGTPVITDTYIDIPIALGNLLIPDNSTVNMTFGIYMKTTGTVQSGKNLQFMIDQTNHGWSANTSGSLFAPDFGAVITSNIFNITVTATKLTVTAPSLVPKNANFSLTVSSSDIYGNTDPTNTSQVTLSRLSGSGTLSSATGLIQNLIAGTYTWTDLQYDKNGAFIVQASAIGFTPGVSNIIVASENVSATIGTGTSTQTNNPFYPYFGYSRAASIYTNAEIGGYGNITSLAWNVATSASMSDPVKIYLISTSATTVPATDWTTLTTGATLVYNGTASWGTTGWYNFNITPFSYIANNLMVLTESNYGGGGTSPYPYFYYSTAPSSMSAYLYQDNSAPTGSLSTTTSRPNIQINITGGNMDYAFTNTTQNTATVDAGTTTQQVIGIQVYTGGSSNPLSITRMTVNASGTTNMADISNARIYYTGLSSTFATTTQFGSTVATPTASNFDITGAATLGNGINYFWLTYDINPSAVNNNVVDGQCNLVTVGGVDYVPDLTSPVGNRQIVNKTLSSVTVTQASTSDVALGATNKEILRLDFNIAGPATGSILLNSVSVNSSNQDDADIAPNGVKLWSTGATSTFSATTAVGIPQTLAAGSATFSGLNSNLPVGHTYIWVTYDISPTATPGHYVDAMILANNMNIAGSTYNSITDDPAGTRTILPPLSGTVTVGSGGTYPSLTGVGGLFEALNMLGLSSNLIANITSNLTEDGTNPLNQWGEIGGSGYTLTIQPADATEKIISGAVAVTNGMIRLDGVDRATFDGRFAGSGVYLRFVNTNATQAVFTFINDASNNTLQYCKIYGRNTGAGGVINISTTSGTTGNDNNSINYCDLGPDGTNYPAYIIYSVGTSGKENNNLQLLFNSIHDYYNASGNAYGIYATTGNSDWNVALNSFYQSVTRTGVSGTLYDIYINNTATGNHFAINGNFFGGSSPAATGTPLTITGTAAAYLYNAIYLAAGTTVASTIQGNTIRNFSWLTSSGTNTIPGVFCGIYVTAGNVNIGDNTANIIGDGASVDNIVVNNTTTGSGLYGIVSSSTGTVNISNNQLAGLSCQSSTASVGGYVKGIITSGTGGNYTIDNNTIGSTTIPYSIRSGVAGTTTGATFLTGIQNSATGTTAITNNTIADFQANGATSSGQVTGISNTGGTATIYNNTINSFDSYSTSTTTGANTTLIGILATSSLPGQTITNNRMWGLANYAATAAVYVAGIYGAGPTSGTNIIGQNLIHSLVINSTSTSAAITGMAINGGSFIIQNNILRLGLDAGGNSLTNGINIRGIYENSSSYPCSLYFNSFYIGGDNVASTSSTVGFQTAVSSGTRTYENNIFVNARSNASGAAINYAFRTAGLTGMTSDYNIFYAPNTGGMLYNDGSADRATMSFIRQYTVNQELHSGVGNPNLVNPTGTFATLDMHVQSPTPAEGSGLNIAGITTDYSGALRAGLSPTDIGALAGNYVTVDIFTPAISYTLLGPTIVAPSNTLAGVTITDAGSGVPISGTYVPQIWYKKNAGGTWVNNPGTLMSGTGNSGTWNFVIDYSIPAFGGAPVVGDVIYYYVAAQDQALIPNIWFNPFIGASQTDVVTFGTPPTTPNSYTIVPPFSGNYYVGVAAGHIPVQTYPTLTAAIADVNSHVFTGPVTLTLTDANYSSSETFPITINANSGMSQTYNLTIVPEAGVSPLITGSNSTCLLKLNGADYVTINGSNSGGTTRDMTFTNTYSSSGPAVIWVASLGTGAGATYNTIENCNINNGYNNGSSTYGIFVGGSSIGNGGDDNDNLTIQNCSLSTAYIGIWAQATSTSGQLDNLQIIGNSVGSSNSANYIGHDGIMLAYVNNSLITQNSIFNILSGSNYTPVGMTLSTSVINSTISRNNINNVNNNTSSGGYGARGMYVNTGNSVSNLTIANNFISNIGGDGYSGFSNSSPVGMYFDGTTGGLNIWYNSVDMSGSVSYSTGVLTTALLFYSSTITNIDLRNNIFMNSITHASSYAGTKSYAIYSTAPASSFTQCNYNDYYATGPAAVFGYFSGDIATLAAWKTATGKDANSISVNPSFLSNTDLHITPTYCPLNNLGTPISGLTTDYDGDTRSLTTPDMGADEYTPPTILSPTNPGGNQVICQSNAPAYFTVVANGTNPPGTRKWYSNAGLTNVVFRGDVFNTGTVNKGNYTWYVTDSVNTCESTPLMVTLQIDSVTVPGVVSGGNNFCQGTPNGVLTLNNYWGSIVRWESSPDGSAWTPFANTANTWNPGAPLQTTWYRAIVNSGVCGEQASVPTIVTVRALPTPTASNDSPKCVGQNVQLTSGGGATYSWSGPGAYTSSAQNPLLNSVNQGNAGLYTVTVTHASGCALTATTTVVVNSNPSPTASSNTPVCEGGTLSLSVTSSTLYSWSGPNGFASTLRQPSIPNVTLAASGTYFVTVTNVFGCSTVTSTTVVIKALPTPTASSNTPVCLNGTINLNAGGGSTYAWSGPNGFSSTLQTPAILNAALVNAGTYTVTVTGSNACSASTTTTVVVNPLPIPTATYNNPVCVGADINLNAGGGSSYNWSGPNGFSSNDQDPSISNAATSMNGTYLVTVTDSHGCSASTQVIVTVHSLPVPSANNYSPVCDGQTLILTSLGGGVGGTYAWSGPNGFTANTQNATIPVAHMTANGLYTVTATDTYGCSATATTTATIHPIPTPTASSNAPVCEMVQLNLYASGGLSYSWSGPNGFNSILQNPSIASPTVAANGDYIVTVTNEFTCTATATASVTIWPAPATSASSNTPVCVGQSLTLQATGGTGYTWTGPNGFSSNIQNPVIDNVTLAAAGTYSVSITDVHNCVPAASPTTIVVVNPLPTPGISNNSPVCQLQQLQLHATGGTSYVWSGPNGFTSTLKDPVINNATPAASGTYFVTVSDDNSCSAVTQISATVYALPVPLASSNTPVCVGQSLNFNGDGAGAGGSYSWSGPNGFSSSDQNPFISNASLAATGTYHLTITDNHSCSDVTTTNALVNPNPTTFDIGGSGTYCNGADGRTITISGSQTGVSYQLFMGTNPVGDPLIGNGSALHWYNILAGTFTVTATWPSSGCNSLMAGQVVITEDPAISAAISPDPAYPQVNVGMQMHGNPTGGTGAFTTHHWTGTGTGFLSNFNIENPVFTSPYTGNYSLTYTVTDSHGCTATSSIIVAVSTQPDAPIMPDQSRCGTGTVTMTATPGAGGNQIQFSLNGVTVLSTVTTPPFNFTTPVIPASTSIIVFARTYNSFNGLYSNWWQAFATAYAPTNGGTATAANAVVCYNTSTTIPLLGYVGDVLHWEYRINGGSWTDIGNAGVTTLNTGNLTDVGFYEYRAYVQNGTCLALYSTLAALNVYQVTQSGVITPVNCNGGNDGAITIIPSGGGEPLSFNWTPTASTFKDLTGIPAGSYHLVITEVHGCTSGATYVVPQPSPWSVTHTITDANCNGQNNGSIDLGVSGNTGPYFFNWSNNATTEDISGLVTGNYLVTITDSHQCTYTDSYNVGQPPALSVVPAVTNVSCFNGTNGAINLTVTGGTSSYTYTWTGGATTKDITGLIAGNYSVTVTDAHGCTYTNNWTVTQPLLLTATPTIVNVSCNSGSNGSISLATTGGTQGYTYLWSVPTVGSVSSITGLVAGPYSVTITDAHNCVFTDNFTITEPEALANTPTQVNVSCHGGNTASVSLAITGGTSPYTYHWSVPGTTNSISGLTAGSYDMTVTDANGCTITGSYTITEPPALVQSANLTNISCNGFTDGSIDLTATGGTSPLTYQWSTTATSEDLSNLGAGPYTVTVTDGHNCTSVNTYTLTQPAVLLVTDVVTNVSCNGGNNGGVTLTVTGGTPEYAYIWSTGATTKDIAGKVAGIYSVTVTDGHTCVFTGSWTVSQPNALSLTQVITNVSCNNGTNGSIVLTPGGGTTPYTYLWTSGATTKDLTGKTAGTYSVTITDANNCTFTGGPFTITQPIAIGAVPAITNVSCNSGNNGAISLTMSGGTAPFTYHWSNSATTKDLSGLSSGTYSVTVTDLNNCTFLLGPLTVTQPNAIIVTPATTNVNCFGGNNGAITLTITGGSTPFTYHWSNNATTKDISGLTAGSYLVTITDALGCLYLNTYSVTQPAVLSVTPTVTPVHCTGGNDGGVSLAVSGGTLSYTYLWSNTATTSSISGVVAGTYLFTVTDAHNCTQTGSSTVNTLYPIPHVTNTGLVQTICSGSPSTLVTITGDVAGTAFNWTATATGGITGFTAIGSGTIPVQTISNPGTTAGTVTYAIVPSANGCTGPTVNYVIIVNPRPHILNTLLTQAMCSGANSTLVPFTTDIAGTTVSWTATSSSINLSGFVASGSGSIPSQTILNSGNTIETVTYTATPSINGCTGNTFTYLITVYNAPTAQLTGAGTNCYGQPYPITINFTGTPPWTVYLSDGNNVNILQGINSTPFVYSPYTTTNATFFVFGLNDAHCSGTNFGTPLHVNVTPQPTGQLSGPSGICPGSPANLQVALTGTPPWNITWSDGTSHVVTGILTSPYSFSVTPSSTTTYSLTSITDNNCNAISYGSPLQVMVYTQPTASINGTQNTCAGQSASLTVQLTGTPPYSIVYLDATGQHTVNGIMTATYTLTVTPAATTTYSLVSVQDAHCQGSVSGNASVTVYAIPTATWIASNSLCLGSSTDLQIQLTGSGPWNLTWNDGTAHVVTGIVSSPYSITVNPTVTKTYIITSLSDAHCTATNINASFTLNVYNLPSAKITGTTAVCEGSSVTLSLILTGTAPWTVMYSDGTPHIIGNILSSPYNFNITATATTVFTLTGVTDAHCDGTIIGAPATVTVSPQPEVYANELATVTNVCSGSPLNITLHFTAGTPPFEVKYRDYNNVVHILSNMVEGSVVTILTSTIPGPYYYTLMTVTDAVGCIHTYNLVFTLNVVPQPVANAGNDVTVALGNSTSFFGSAGAGTQPYSYQWLPATYLDNPLVNNPVCTPVLTTLYTMIVTDANGCTASDQLNVTVIGGTNAIYGILAYDNAVSTPLTNTRVFVKNYSGAKIDSTVTDQTGLFLFNSLPNGNFYLDASCTKPWGGVNSTDALLILEHFAHIAGIPGIPLTGVKLLAGNVDGNNVINAVDALMVAQRSVGTITTFPVGDWVFEHKFFSIPTITPSNNFKGLCFGDVNASNVPSAKHMPSVRMITQGELIVDPNTIITLPVSIDRNCAVGAISLAFSYPVNDIEILGAEVPGSSVQPLINQKDGIVHMSWYCLDELELNNNNTIINLKIRILNAASLPSLNFTVTGEGEIADKFARVIPDVNLGIPKLVPATGSLSLSQNYPNPFDKTSVITYNLPEAGKVTITVYNSFGESVMVLENAWKDAGTQNVTIEGSVLAQGIYWYRMDLRTLTGAATLTRKMTVIR